MGNFKDKEIAIVGAGLGGAFAAALLQAHGYKTQSYERAPTIEHVGAGIHLSPNLVRLLMRIGVFDRIASSGFEPSAFVSRSLRDNQELNRLPLGKEAWLKYGAPYLTIHRGDLREAMLSRVAPDTLHLGKSLSDVHEQGDRVLLRFEDGSEASADTVIGADGLRSKVREVLRGHEPPKFGMQEAFRAQVPSSCLSNSSQYSLTKWWFEDRFIISYFMSEKRDSVYFAAGVPSEGWKHDAPWIHSSREELIERMQGVTPEVAALLENAQDVTLWPLFERPPTTDWGQGKVVLLGDACHPMRPHMAQGAAMALEDAALLTRFLESETFDSFEKAYSAYAKYRYPRTSIVQEISTTNTWLKAETDPTWLYGYDAVTADLAQPLLGAPCADSRAR